MVTIATEVEQVAGGEHERDDRQAIGDPRRDGQRAPHGERPQRCHDAASEPAHVHLPSLGSLGGMSISYISLGGGGDEALELAGGEEAHDRWGGGARPGECQGETRRQRCHVREERGRGKNR